MSEKVFESKLTYLPEPRRFEDAIEDIVMKRMFRKNTFTTAQEIKKLVEDLEWAVWNLKDIKNRNIEWLEGLGDNGPVDYHLGAASHTADHKMALEFIADLVHAIDLEKSLQEVDYKGFLNRAESYQDCCPWPKCQDHCPKE